MLDALLRRFTSNREVLKAGVAQLAMTWGSNVLFNTIADQADQLRVLELARDGYAADVERLAAERDETVRTCDLVQAQNQKLRTAYEAYSSRLTDNEIAEIGAIYPTPEDLAPLATDTTPED